MGVPSASLRTRNIELSVQRMLKELWADPLALAVGWNDGSFDPDSLLYGAGDPPSVWATVTWPSRGAGGKTSSTMQVDVVSRRGRDPLADLVVRATDSLVEVMRAPRGAGERARSIPVYDFSAVVDVSDVETLIPGNVLLVQSPGGRLGERSDIVGPRQERDLWRATITYRILLITDASRGDYYA